MTTYTADQIIAIGGNRWTKPGTDTVRIYINDWPQYIGLEVSRYKTGNISGAELNGRPLSNTKAGRLLSTKVWWENGTIHITPRSALAEDYADELIDGIAAAVRAVA